MKLDLLKVITCENTDMTKEELIELESFDSSLGKFPITKKSPVSIHLSNVDGRRLIIEGTSDVTVTVPCDRCLSDVSLDFHLEFRKEFAIDGHDLVPVNEEDEEPDYLIGCNLDLDKLIHGEILVNWPMKVLCREDCKGICRKCGTNLNLRTCDCDQTVLDPRMAAIQDVFNKFKEV